MNRRIKQLVGACLAVGLLVGVGWLAFPAADEPQRLDADGDGLAVAHHGDAIGAWPDLVALLLLHGR